MSTFGAPVTQCCVEKIYIDRKNKNNQIVELVGRGNINSLSRGAPSTTRPPLRCGPDRRKPFGDQAFFGDFRQMAALSSMQVRAAENGTTRERADTNGTNLAQAVPTMFRPPAIPKGEWNGYAQ